MDSRRLRLLSIPMAVGWSVCFTEGFKGWMRRRNNEEARRTSLWIMYFNMAQISTLIERKFAD